MITSNSLAFLSYGMKTCSSEIKITLFECVKKGVLDKKWESELITGVEKPRWFEYRYMVREKYNITERLMGGMSQESVLVIQFYHWWH